MTTRRRFLQVGVASAVVLAVAHRLDASQGSRAPVSGLRFLDSRSAPIVDALVPVVLEGSLPADATSRALARREVVEAFDRAVSGMSPAVRDEVDQLFGLLRFAPARLALAGLWEPVERASAADVAAFLTRWRHSRFDLQRAAYQALTQLIQAAWLDNPLSWASTGYPGPPRLP